MRVYVVVCNNLELEGEVELVGIFKTLASAEQARRAHAKDARDDADDEEDAPDDSDSRWDLCGGLVVYEIQSGEVQE